MIKTHHEIFEELLNEAKNDENITGFFLGGSRGKGYENDLSDYDLQMIVKKDGFGYRSLDFVRDLIFDGSCGKFLYSDFGSDLGARHAGGSNLEVLNIRFPSYADLIAA